MTEATTIVLVAVVVIALFFGASSIMTAFNKAPPVVKAFMDETDQRCDICLSQFQEVSCNHLSESKVCIAMRNYWCNLNCTVIILS
jgi:hypothetical protein